MNLLIRNLILILIVVTSTQLFTHFIPYYNLIDEVILVLLLALAILHNKFIVISRKKAIVLLFFVAGFLVSSIYNFYSAMPLLIKSFYYLKTLLIFGLLSFLSSKFLTQSDLVRIYKLALILCSLALIEFFYVQFVFFKGGVQYEMWGLFLKSRDGIYRAASLTGHPISLGMLSLITFVFVIEKYGRIKVLHFIILIGAILVSGTRIPMLLSITYIIVKTLDYKLFKVKELKLKYFMAIFIPIMLVFGALNINNYITEKNEVLSSRGVAISKGIPLLKSPKNLILGTGVGSFGMYESIEYNSNVYEEIGFPSHYKEILLTTNRSTGIESFLAMIIIEMGIIGAVVFYLIVYPLKIKYSFIEVFLMFTLLLYSVAYPIYTLPFVIILNVLFPYFSPKNITK
jgi:hypothetical protein